MADDEHTLLTLAEAAAMLNPVLTARSMRSAIANGKIASIKVAGKVFIYRTEIERLGRGEGPEHAASQRRESTSSSAGSGAKRDRKAQDDLRKRANELLAKGKSETS